MESFVMDLSKQQLVRKSLDKKIKTLYNSNAHPKKSCSERANQFKIFKVYVAKAHNKHRITKCNCEINCTAKFSTINVLPQNFAVGGNF